MAEVVSWWRREDEFGWLELRSDEMLKLRHFGLNLEMSEQFGPRLCYQRC